MKRTYFYSAFGLKIRSDRRLPGLFAVDGGDGEDLRISWDCFPSWWNAAFSKDHIIWHTSPYKNERGESTLTIWTVRNGAYFRILYADGAQFVVDRKGTQLWAKWPEAMTPEDAA